MTALSAISNVIVKFVSQKAPAMSLRRRQSGYGVTPAGLFGGQTPGRQKSRDERGRWRDDVIEGGLR